MSRTAVLLATYNAGDYLRGLLDSLMAQTVSDFEVCYHDDGSKDGSVDLLKKYSTDYPGRFVEIDGPPTGGAKANFMYMLNSIEADYYLFCDDDDVWLPRKVEMERAAVISNESKGCEVVPTAVFCDVAITDGELNEISPTCFSYMDRDPHRIALKNLLLENVAPGNAIALNKSLRDIVVRLKNIKNIPMHDHWTMVCGAAAGQVIYLPECLMLYRQHAENEVGAVHTGIGEKIKRNLLAIFTKSGRAKKQEWFEQAYMLANELLALDDESIFQREVYDFLREFAVIKALPRAKRLAFYKENNIDKTSGNFWMKMWI